MYGTVARMQMKPGTEEQFMALGREIMARRIPGAIADYVYKMDNEPDVYYLAVVFESKEAYFANADSAEQAAEYEKLAAMFAAEPEWHDGEVVASWGISPAP
ncbi:MAG: antibiotic biosynthesis monooxygenase [Anaerolineae bacterium]